jgi:hypothetical protein
MMFIAERNPGERVASPGSRIARMSAWLADQAVHDGAVVSWQDAGGGWSDAYPEIAGYYLSYLACSGGDDGAARAIFAWLERITADGPPLTRYFLDRRDDDWRNRFVFAFDLAILLRGLVQMRHAEPASADRLISRCGEALVGISHDGVLASHVARQEQQVAMPPERWSTRPGVHHLKAAAALAVWSDARAQALAARTIDHWAPQLPTIIATGTPDHAHPYLYGIEGLLLHHARTRDATLADAATEAYRALMELLDDADEAGRGNAGDVAAQMLRAGTTLQRIDRISPEEWRPTRRRFMQRLRALDSAEGAVLFDARGHRNVWATLFAWQAEHMLAAADGDVPAACCAPRWII